MGVPTLKKSVEVRDSRGIHRLRCLLEASLLPSRFLFSREKGFISDVTKEKLIRSISMKQASLGITTGAFVGAYTSATGPGGLMVVSVSKVVGGLVGGVPSSGHEFLHLSCLAFQLNGRIPMTLI